MRINFRLETKHDIPFLVKLYRSTREHEMLHLGWTEAQKGGFIEFQFMAQLSDYRANYKNAEFKIVLINRKEAGRLYVQEEIKSIKIIDISLLPEYRGKGIGTKIFDSLIRTSEEKGKDLELHVEFGNRALKLYKRLNFEIIETGKTHYLMIRKPFSEKT